MKHIVSITVKDYKFEFHEWGYEREGQLDTTMQIKVLSEHLIKKLCKQIPGLISIRYEHQFTLVVERGNHLFPWKEIIEPLIQFLYDKNKPREELVNEVENKSSVL